MRKKFLQIEENFTKQNKTQPRRNETRKVKKGLRVGEKYGIILRVREANEMGVLDGFSAFNFEEGVPYVSVTINGVTFNRSVVMKLDYPEYALLLINSDEKKIAVQACDEQTENATSFYKEKKSGVISVRWNGKDLLNTFQALMGWDLKQKAYRIEGTHLKAERAILFDLNQATPLS